MSPPTPVRWLIGLDGGGSGTRAVLAAPDRRVLGRGQAGPSGLGQGIEQAWRHLRAAWAEAFTQAGLAAHLQDEAALLAQCGLGLGLAGAENPLWVRDFHAQAPACAALVLDSDGFTALLGAHAGAPGALVAVGTGSVGAVLQADGRRGLVGGWGWRLGDEAGGAWLGQQAVRHLQRVLDGRMPGGLAASPLAQAVAARCGADRPRLLDWSFAADQRAYAELAPCVFDHEARDPAAAALVDAALDEVQQIAAALDPAAALPLALAGSIGQRLAPRLATRLRQRLVTPAGDGADGGLHLLRHALARANEPGTGMILPMNPPST